MRSPVLVVTINTHEDDPEGPPRARDNTCRNVAALTLVHSLFQTLHVRPTYLVDHPVAMDGAARERLRAIADESEIGALLHPWCTPPFVAGGTEGWALAPHRLPPALQESKLRTLCEAIEGGLGVRPRSYRAGHGGFDHSTVPILERLGFAVDASMGSWWLDDPPDGPRFVGAPAHPYHLDEGDVCRAGHSRVVEVPMPSVVMGRAGRALEALTRKAPAFGRVLVKSGLRTLRPERHTGDELCAAADAMAERGLPVFHVMFPSSALLPGASPFVADEPALGELCDRVWQLLEHLTVEHRAISLGLSEVPAYLGESLLPAEAA
jgi:hypothetical protein